MHLVERYGDLTLARHGSKTLFTQLYCGGSHHFRDVVRQFATLSRRSAHPDFAVHCDILISANDPINGSAVLHINTVSRYRKSPRAATCKVDAAD